MKRCLLFDSDGTLVDSEFLNSEAMAAELQESGISESAENLHRSYSGWMFSAVLEDLQQRHRTRLDDKFTDRFRQRASQIFEKSLRPVAHIPEVLKQLNQPMCVASNAPMAKLELALRVTGLDGFFPDAVYSAYDIECWKPEPGLFLHAATSMGFEPSQCVVIEDSMVGVTAALAAGIDVVHYDPKAVAAAGDKVCVIQSMSELPLAIDKFS